MTTAEIVYVLVSAASTLVGCRLAYGSWPWEARKTWHWNKED